MAEKNSIDSSSLRLDKEDTSPSQEIRDAMAETRASLSQRLSALEDEVQRRVLDTFDQVNFRITQTTERISDQLTKPINELQNRIRSVQEKVREEPDKALLVSACSGFAVGAVLSSSRRRHRALSLQAQHQLSVARSRPASQAGSAFRELFSMVAFQIAQRLIQSGVDEFNRHRT